MTGKAKRKVMEIIQIAENIGAHEIIERAQELLDMDTMRECKKSMDANGMTMYCNGANCPDHSKCLESQDWFGGTGIQPSLVAYRGIGQDLQVGRVV